MNKQKISADFYWSLSFSSFYFFLLMFVLVFFLRIHIQNKRKTNNEQETLRRFRLLLKTFPLLWLLLFVEHFLRYVCLWPPILLLNDDPRYFYDHDLISIWWFEPRKQPKQSIRLDHTEQFTLDGWIPIWTVLPLAFSRVIRSIWTTNFFR